MFDFITKRKNVEICNIVHDMKLSNRIVKLAGFLKSVSIDRLKSIKPLNKKEKFVIFSVGKGGSQTIAVTSSWIPHTTKIDK